MAEFMAYVNGERVPASRAAISVFDRGLRWGDACYDVERSFGHKIFRLREHLARMYRSLRYTRIPQPMSIEEMEKVTLDLFERNVQLIAADDDLEVAQIITRGTMMEPNKPNVIVYTRPLDYAMMVKRFAGVRLLTPSTRRMPAESLCPGAKIANKMSFHVANAEIQAADPEAYSLLLDIHGHVAESSNCNFFFAAGGRLCTPSLGNCLPGISRKATIELARGIGIEVEEGMYTIFDVYNADEAFLTGTMNCLFHATHVNGIAMGENPPGEMTRRLQEEWEKLVGIDFVEQARKKE